MTLSSQVIYQILHCHLPNHPPFEGSPEASRPIPGTTKAGVQWFTGLASLPINHEAYEATTKNRKKHIAWTLDDISA